MVYKNKIHSSRSEGIFIIEGGFCWIKSNQIYDNNDGIIMFDSYPHLTENNIHMNQRAGIIACGNSFPKVEKNDICGNSMAGIVVRHNSFCTILNNRIFSNFYQISARNLNQKQRKQIIDDNEINGENEFLYTC